MSAAVIKFARDNVALRLYGGLDYYMEHVQERGRIIGMLVSVIDEQQKELTALKEQQRKLVEKVLGIEPTTNLIPTNPIPTNPIPVVNGV